MLTSFLRNRVVGALREKPKEEQRRIRERILAFQIGPYGWLTNIPTALLFGRNLKMLATIYMTDKWNHHWYVRHYETLLREKRRKNIHLLEIGVGGDQSSTSGGHSLRMWNDYLPNGRIFGIDIIDKSPHNRKRIKTFHGSQVDPVFLDDVVRQIGRIDFIIDDGSHISEHILFTFQHLFPHLADGGIYVIEDTQTSYWAEWGGNEIDRNDLNTSMGYFKSLTDGLSWEDLRGGYNPTYFDRNIESIAFFHNMIVIKKGPNSEGTRPPE
jgi:hypothetical protein